MNKPTEEDLKKLKDAGYRRRGGRRHSRRRGREMPRRRRQARHEDPLGAARLGRVQQPGPGQSGRDLRRQPRTPCAPPRRFGADAVLLVPCRIGGMKMPRPWEFLIDFDEKTGHIRKVAAGDNAPYADYIKAHNHATDTSREHVQRLIPLAEKMRRRHRPGERLEQPLGQAGDLPALRRLLPEPVGQGLLRHRQPREIRPARGMDPQPWATCSPKCHAKDFKLNLTDPNGGGTLVNIREGSVRWPVVRHALEKVGYSGWMTIEGGNCSLEEHSRRLDLIIAGK